MTDTMTYRNPGPVPPTAPSPPPPRRRRRSRAVLKGMLAALVAVLLVAGGTTVWALNRYVIDHVEIADVAAYEAAQLAQQSSTTASDDTGAKPEGDGATTTGTPTDTSPTSPADTTAAASTATEATSATTATATAPTSITVEKVVSGSGADTVTAYVADIVLGDTTELRSAFADNKFGLNIVANTSTIAEENGATFAINGDYYGFRQSGIVIRNGVVYRDEGARTGLAIYRDGTMRLYDETTTSADELIAAGVLHTLSFGPGIVEDGAVVAGIEDVEVDTNIGNHSIQGNQPRTGVGMISANHFVFIVVDGRSSGYSRGVTLDEFAQMFIDRGATVAYNLDGGGSSTMYFDGEVVNNPLGKGNERGTSDILYVAAS